MAKTWMLNIKVPYSDYQVRLLVATDITSPLDPRILEVLADAEEAGLIRGEITICYAEISGWEDKVRADFFRRYLSLCKMEKRMAEELREELNAIEATMVEAHVQRPSTATSRRWSKTR